MSTPISLKLPEQVMCPLCFSESKKIKEIKTINPNSNLIIHLHECKECKHWWHSPLPTQAMLNDWYTNGNEYVVPKDYATKVTYEPLPTTTPLWEKIFNDLSIYSKKINTTEKKFNYLEVGIGSGGLFNFFKEKAHIAYGIEPGDWVSGEKNNVVNSIENLPNSIMYDVIIAHDVLEHLNNPVLTLKEVSKFANDGCIISCTFPNKDSLKAYIQKEYWHMIRPFGHLHYFSKKSTHILFQKSGWKILSLKNVRISENSILDLIKSFDWSQKNIFYKTLKSLLLGQILLGKDQWVVIAKYSKK